MRARCLSLIRCHTLPADQVLDNEPTLASAHEAHALIQATDVV